MDEGIWDGSEWFAFPSSLLALCPMPRGAVGPVVPAGAPIRWVPSGRLRRSPSPGEPRQHLPHPESSRSSSASSVGLGTRLFAEQPG